MKVVGVWLGFWGLVRIVGVIFSGFVFLGLFFFECLEVEVCWGVF